MLTRCPQCATTFRVTPEQLKVRQGRVRCGACQEVFSALDTLVDEVLPPAPRVELSTDLGTEPGGTEPGTDHGFPEETVPDPLPPEPPPPEPEVADLNTAIAASEAEVAVAPVVALEPTAAPTPITEPEPAPTAESFPPPPPPPLEPLLHEAPRGRRWPWALGIIAALILLAAQAVIHFRTEIGVRHPDMKPMLVTACAALGCQVPLPRKVDLVSIEASDLFPDPAGQLMLTATLKNRAAFAQEYPYLELTLTDTTDRALVRRVLAPADYLPPKTIAAAGLDANAELALALAVTAPDIPAAGYRLYLFYP